MRLKGCNKSFKGVHGRDQEKVKVAKGAPLFLRGKFQAELVECYRLFPESKTWLVGKGFVLANQRLLISSRLHIPHLKTTSRGTVSLSASFCGFGISRSGLPIFAFDIIIMRFLYPFIIHFIFYQHMPTPSPSLCNLCIYHPCIYPR